MDFEKLPTFGYLNTLSKSGAGIKVKWSFSEYLKLDNFKSEKFSFIPSEDFQLYFNRRKISFDSNNFCFLTLHKSSRQASDSALKADISVVAGGILTAVERIDKSKEFLRVKFFISDKDINLKPFFIFCEVKLVENNAVTHSVPGTKQKFDETSFFIGSLLIKYESESKDTYANSMSDKKTKLKVCDTFNSHSGSDYFSEDPLNLFACAALTSDLKANSAKSNQMLSRNSVSSGELTPDSTKDLIDGDTLKKNLTNTFSSPPEPVNIVRSTNCDIKKSPLLPEYSLKSTKCNKAFNLVSSNEALQASITDVIDRDTNKANSKNATNLRSASYSESFPASATDVIDRDIFKANSKDATYLHSGSSSESLPALTTDVINTDTFKANSKSATSLHSVSSRESLSCSSEHIFDGNTVKDTISSHSASNDGPKSISSDSFKSHLDSDSKPTTSNTFNLNPVSIGEFNPTDRNISESDQVFDFTSKLENNNDVKLDSPDADVVTFFKEDMKRLLINQKYTDVAISVQGTIFRAHKAILYARSSVLAAMFDKEALQNHQQEITIKDFSSEVISLLLCYIYTSETDGLNAENSFELLLAAKRFGIPSLEKVCTNYLTENMTTKSVLRILGKINILEDGHLEEAAINCFLNNAEQIMKTQEWLSFLRSNVESANSILIRLFKKNSSN